MAARVNGIKKNISMFQTLSYKGKSYTVVVNTIEDRLGLSIKAKGHRYQVYQSISSMIARLEEMQLEGGKNNGR